MNLEDLGYDVFLNKQSSDTTPVIGEDILDAMLGGVSADKISSGIAQSSNLLLNIDFNSGAIQFKEGDIIRAELRKFTDKKIGLRVYDTSGNTVVDNTV